MICAPCAELTATLRRLAPRESSEDGRLRLLAEVRAAHRVQCASAKEDGTVSPTQCDCQHEVQLPTDISPDIVES